MRQGLQRKSFFAARPQKRLERKARFLARERQKGAQLFLTLVDIACKTIEKSLTHCITKN
jgi:hypothetical protein